MSATDAVTMFGGLLAAGVAVVAVVDRPPLLSTDKPTDKRRATRSPSKEWPRSQIPEVVVCGVDDVGGVYVGLDD